MASDIGRQDFVDALTLTKKQRRKKRKDVAFLNPMPTRKEERDLFELDISTSAKRYLKTLPK